MFDPQTTLTVHTRDDGSRTLTVTFLAPVQATLLEDFEERCWNEVLTQAHAAGHMPTGPILISTETYTPTVEPGAVVASIDALAQLNAALAGDIVQVTGNVELGLSL